VIFTFHEFTDKNLDVVIKITMAECFSKPLMNIMFWRNDFSFRCYDQMDEDLD